MLDLRPASSPCPGSKPDDGPWACLKPNLKRRIWTLRDGQCRWPLWDELPERDDDRFYCGRRP
jgi:hypothetical protein